MPGREVFDRETPHRKLAMICHNQQLYFNLGHLKSSFLGCFWSNFFMNVKILIDCSKFSITFSSYGFKQCNRSLTENTQNISVATVLGSISAFLSVRVGSFPEQRLVIEPTPVSPFILTSGRRLKEDGKKTAPLRLDLCKQATKGRKEYPAGIC